MDHASKLCALLCAILGTLLHFLWGWLGKPRLAAPLLAVNESIFEHTKLLIVPVLGLLPLYGSLLGLPPAAVMGPGLDGLLRGVAVMVLGFCFWVQSVGPHNLWVGIGDFLLSVLVCWHRIGALTVTGGGIRRWQPVLAAGLLCLPLFTWAPPRLRIFRCPMTGQYGLKSKSPRKEAFGEMQINNISSR